MMNNELPKWPFNVFVSVWPFDLFVVVATSVMLLIGGLLIVHHEVAAAIEVENDG